MKWKKCCGRKLIEKSNEDAENALNLAELEAEKIKAGIYENPLHKMNKLAGGVAGIAGALTSGLASAILSGGGSALSTFSEVFNDKEQDAINNIVTNLPDIVRVLASRIDDLREELKISDEIPLDTSFPVLPSIVCSRSETIRRITANLKSKQVIHIYGSSGAGKTTLTNLLIQSLNLKGVYFDLTTVIQSNHSPVGYIISNYLDGLEDIEQTVDYVCLDNLPIFTSSALWNSLIKLISDQINKGVKVFLLSHHDLSDTLDDFIKSDEASIIDCPFFEPDEIREFASLLGAELNSLTSAFDELAQTTTRGHPLLVNAFLKFIKSKNWDLNVNVFSQLLKGDFKENLETQVYEMLEKTTSNTQRELLYRLAEIVSNFDLHLADLLSNVAPQICGWHKNFIQMIDIWIIKQSSKHYSISPLLGDLGGNLAIETRTHVNHILAFEVLRKGELNPLFAHRAIIYFFKAKDFTMACIVIIKGLMALQKANSENTIVESFSLYFTRKPIPTSVDLSLRVTLRCLQIQQCYKSNENNEFLVSDLQELLVEKGIDDYNIYAAVSTLVFNINLPVVDRIHLLTEALQKNNCISKPKFENEDELRKLIPLSDLYFVLGHQLDNHNDVLSWVGGVVSLPPEFILDSFESSKNYLICKLVIEKIGRIEAKWGRTNNQWGTVAKSLERVIDRAKDIGANTLLSLATVSQIHLFGDGNHDVNKAESLAENIYPLFAPLSSHSMIVAVAIGVQLFLHNKHDSSRKWLEIALKDCHQSDMDAFIVGTLHLAALTDDVDKAIGSLTKCLSLTKNADDVDYINKVLLYGELSIAYFEIGHNLEAYDYLNMATTLLLENDQDEINRDKLVLITHQAGYLYSVISTGKKPQTKLANGDDYVSLIRGSMLPYKPGRCDFWDLERENSLPIQMMLIAEKLCKYDVSSYWADKTIAHTSKNQGIRKDAFGEGIYLLPYYLKSSRISEGLIRLIESIEQLWERMKAEGLSNQYNSIEEFGNIKLIFHGFLSVAFYLFGGFCNIISTDEVDSTIKQIKTCKLPTYLNESRDLFIEMCQLVFFEEMNEDLLKSKADTIEQSYVELSIIYQFASSFNENIGMKVRVSKQISIAHYFRGYIDFGLNPVKLFLYPLFSAYWQQLFSSHKGLFNSPMLVERMLSEAKDSNEILRFKKEIEAMSFGLGLSPSEEISDWISGLGL